MIRVLAFLFLLLTAGPAWALQPVYVDQMGAKPDGVALTTCSMTATSAVLTCTGAKFAPADVGKAIGVYGAKTAVNGYVQVLTTTIASRQSLTQVTLAVAATVTVTPSPRVVYGTDNTVVLQRIIDTTVAAADGRGGNVGGQVRFGPGIYLVKKLSFPCSRVGAFSIGAPGDPQPCPRSYNNIWIMGAGQQATTIENWDPSTGVALMRFGALTLLPNIFSDGNALLSGIQLSDFTIRQVPHGLTALKVIESLPALVDSLIERLTITGTSYECLYVHGWRLTVRQNYASGCGLGGPAYTLTLSAYNIMTCVDCLIEDNVFDTALAPGSYAMEGNIRQSVVQGNHFTCTAQGPGGVQFGSANLGSYGTVFKGNTLYNCGVVFGNGNGTSNSFIIKDNVFINSYLTIESGVESQSVDVSNQWGVLDTVIHGVSVIDGNLFLIDGFAAASSGDGGINLGGLQSYMGQESYSITNNTAVIRQTYCSTGTRLKCQVDGDCVSGWCGVPVGLIYINRASGGVRWTPSTACVQASGPYGINEGITTYMYPVVYNGYYYRCTTAGTTGPTEPTWPTGLAATVTDGTAVWTNAGRKPFITIANNSIMGPETRLLDYIGQSPTAEISFRVDSDRDAVLITNFSANYPWFLQSGGNNGAGVNETIPAGVSYGDRQRYLAALPTLGYYRLNTQITNTVPATGQRGWVATREGRAGTPWAATTAYGFAAWVVPTADNAHAYTQRTGAGCTSSGSPPTWPTDAGATVTDGDCVWKESGAAVLWLQF